MPKVHKAEEAEPKPQYCHRPDGEEEPKTAEDEPARDDGVIHDLDRDLGFLSPAEHRWIGELSAFYTVHRTCAPSLPLILVERSECSTLPHHPLFELNGAGVRPA